MGRRRASFWLRLLFILSLLGGLAMAWNWDRKARNEQAAVERLTRRRFSFTYHDTRLATLRNILTSLGINPRLGQRVRTAHFSGDLGTLGDLSDLSKLTDLKSLTLIEADENKDNRGTVVDSLLKAVDCGRIEELVVTTRSGLTDQFLERFSESSSIRALIIADSLVTDAGMNHLRSCPHLSGIDVEGCAVTNAGVEAIIGLPSLNRLFLDRTQVDSGVLKILAKSGTLEVAYLCGTAVSVADAIEFTRERSILLRVGDPLNPHEVQLGEAYRPYEVEVPEDFE